MNEKSIKQLAFTLAKDKCPVCRNVVRHKKQFNVELHNSNYQEFVDQCCELLYCDNCNLPLVDGEIILEIYKKTGMRPFAFTTAKSKVDGIESQMYYKKRTAKHFPKKEVEKCYRVIGKSTSIWNPYTRLYQANEQMVCCPECQQQLIRGETIIPIGENLNLLVEGYVCRKCKAMFVKDADEIAKMIKDNSYSSGFYIDDVAYWQYTELERKKRQEEKRRKRAEEERTRREIQRRKSQKLLDSIVPSVVVISVVYQDGNTAEYIITTDKNDTSVESVIHYSSEAGRELLTAAYVPERKKRGILNGRKYCVFDRFEKHELRKSLIPADITIKANGGYRSSLVNSNLEIVDLLFYSPFNDVYECVHATYDKRECVCYMDVGLYRRFVRECGNPKLWLDFPRSRSSIDGELNEESILMGYGYSVNKKEKLSSRYRQELLAELVDLEILTVSKIVHHLEFCISIHTNHPEAISKWKSDIRFIENYNVNPTRFMLSKYSTDTHLGHR